MIHKIDGDQLMLAANSFQNIQESQAVFIPLESELAKEILAETVYAITDEQLDELGTLADQANNLAAASQMPLPAHIHIEGMRHGLTSIDVALKKIYVDVAGDNPWEEAK